MRSKIGLFLGEVKQRRRGTMTDNAGCYPSQALIKRVARVHWLRYGAGLTPEQGIGALAKGLRQLSKVV
jgi:hypothetical protein